MSEKSIIKRIENMPVQILTTTVGALTLSNVYKILGYTWIRHITMWFATVIIVGYTAKIILYFDTFKKEYNNTILSSLYAGFTMILMILGSYYFEFNKLFGKSIWMGSIILHALHILIFTYKNVLKGIKKENFIPSWFVTYNGIMTSTVAGTVMNEPALGKIIVYYGIVVFFIIIPFIVIKIKKEGIIEAFIHTQAILLAPSSLCLVGYLNFIENFNPVIVYILYIIIFLTLLFVIYMIPKFFSYKFTPGFAGLTFPMAIGVMASIKMSSFLTNKGYENLGILVREISGIQLYITTSIISFVLFNFLAIFIKGFKKM
jgi:exfoliative toxin A/B